MVINRFDLYFFGPYKVDKRKKILNTLRFSKNSLSSPAASIIFRYNLSGTLIFTDFENVFYQSFYNKYCS